MFQQCKSEWLNFRKGGWCLEDDPSSRRSKNATTEENIDCVHYMAMEDSHLTINKIAKVISTSCESIENILLNELGILKISAQ